MARYSVGVLRSAAKEIEAISTRKQLQSIVKRIALPADDPRGTGCEKLAGYDDRYRVRHGNCRADILRTLCPGPACRGPSP